MASRVGRPPREPATPSAVAPALLRWAQERRVDVVLLASRGGLEHEDAARDEVPINAVDLAAMLALAAELAAEPHLALRLPAELRFRRYDAGALAARVAATPRDALKAIERFGALVFPRLACTVSEDAARVRFEARFDGAPRGLGHHVDEYLLAFALAHCRRGPHAVLPTRVWMCSPRPHGDIGPIVNALGTDEIEMGAESTGFELLASDALAPLPALDPMLVAAAEQLASAALATAPRVFALAKTVEARIEGALPAEVTAESVAAGMKMSGRTLQRRLEHEGVRFSALLDQVRERVAKQLLATADVPLAEVAFRVGFSDLATFSRAFKRWTGVPPGAFRRSGNRGTTGGERTS